MKEIVFAGMLGWTAILININHKDIESTQEDVAYLIQHQKPIAVNTFGELNDIKPEHRAIVMAIAMTESSCNYNVKHPDTDTKGIGGIKQSQWTLKSNINSLGAIEEVVEVLESRGLNEWQVIRAYKGGVTNLKSTQQCWDLYLRLNRII